MILDKIENLGRYQLPQKGFEILKSYLSTFDNDSFQKGRFEISGDTFFGIGVEYETKEEDKCLWEAHRKYIDIHYILEGEEVIFTNDIVNMEVSKPYDDKGDYELFEGEKGDAVVLQKGDFLLLYPNEVHKTSILSKNTPLLVKKIVFKVGLSDE